MNDDEAPEAEELSSDELGALWRFLAREGKKHDALDLLGHGLCLIPQNGVAALIAKTKRTPLFGNFDCLCLLLPKCRLPDDSGQGGYLPFVVGQGVSPQQGLSGPL